MEDFAPHALSSGKGSHALSSGEDHSSSSARPIVHSGSHSFGWTNILNNYFPACLVFLPPQPSIPEGYGMDPISSVSSGTEPRAGPKVPENAPAGSSPGIKENNSMPTERFAPHALSSGEGSPVLHMNPPAQSQKKTEKAPGPATSGHRPSSARPPPQTSIQEGFATNPISSVSSGTEPRAGPVEPQVPENAPAGSSPGTGSTSDNQTFTEKGHRIKEK
ncbi:uncharacterized protein Pyn_18268 [Prunus yedoensis var. nudiflora]|uniref:Uncharacterized protein n=1 Tax=Prunus yedoensis var. nudiflora TaxID=2094558 RepID=A0A314YPR8_PRUYE|nr:uncharacterized protein Pyn_18268 [Prunus yedoensis var. nudiflora]